MTGQRRSSEEWQRLIDEFEAGSQSGKAFCLRHSLSPSNFYKRRSTRVSASPYAYLLDVFTRLPMAESVEAFEALLPQRAMTAD